MVFRADGRIENVLQGLQPRDSNQYTKLSCREIERYYRENFYIQNVINLIPEDCNLTNPQWQTDDLDAQDLQDACDAIDWIGDPLDHLNFLSAFSLAQQYGRKYGDGFIFLGINDGRDPAQPVDVKGIKSIDWGIVRHRYDVGLDFQNEGYLLGLDPYSGIDLEGTILFHHSRVLRFPGLKLHGERYHIEGFNQSLIVGLWKAYKTYLSSLKSSSDMLASHSVFKYGLKGLADFVRKGQEKAIKSRFESILLGLRSMGALIYDAGGSESAEFINRSYSGVKDILEHLQTWLIAASGMPRSKVFGNATVSAMSEGSEGDRRTWNEIISRNQNLILKPNHLMLGKYILSASGVAKPHLDIKYEPHYSLSATEQANVRKTHAETDQMYLNMGVLTPEAIAKARFSGTGNSEIILDPTEIAKIKPSLTEGEARNQEKQEPN